MSTLTGKTIGKYTLTERLGSGGMAEVYKAHHPKLDRTVAVKVLHGYLAEGEDFLARFEREARAVASLRHAHIVQIHDFDMDEDTYYMVMEFISGGTLQDRMNELVRSGRFMPLAQVLSILKQVAAALDYAHKKGIIHRDIKPSNILLDNEGEAFLTDFGIARMVSTTQFTSTGALIGTPTYMSPEQSKGEELTAASDIYSLGIILFELLTGQAPFTADTPLAVIHKHVNEPLPSPGSLRPSLPPALEAVVEKALAKDAARRYQGAGEMAQALAQALAGEDLPSLDGEQAKGKALAVQPTEKIDEGELPRKAAPPTVAMSKQTRAEITKEPETVAPLPSEAEKSAPQPVPERKKPPPVKPKKESVGPSLMERLKSKPVLYAIAALLVVVILVVVFTSLSGGGSCNRLDECISLAETMLMQGDIEGAIEAYGRAADMVPPDQHPSFAWLWCDRANLLDEIGLHDQAAGDREVCMAWERGE